MTKTLKKTIEVDDVVPTMKKPESQEHDADANADADAETDVETPFNSPERDSVASPSTAKKTTEVNVKIIKEDENDGNDETEKKVPVAVDVLLKLTELVKEEEEEVKDDKKYSNWPLIEIKDPHRNDVLYGRGGGTNHHSGNKRYRKLVEGRKVDYVNSKRLDKPLVALAIIKEWRAQVPPGRFLKMDDKSGFWQDVGDKKAREKTSQALREKAPLLRKQQEEQRKEKQDGHKNTRFDLHLPNHSNKIDKNLKRVLLARDHSLGRDYVTADDPVSVKGFSWTTPVADVPEEVIPIQQSDSWDDYAVQGSGSISSRSSARVTSTPDPFVNSQYPTALPQDANPVPAVGYHADWAQQYPHHPHTPQPHPTMMNEWRGFHSEDVTRKGYGDYDSTYLQTRSVDQCGDAYRRNGGSYYPHTGNSSSHQSHVESDDYERIASIVGTESRGYDMQNWASKSMNNSPLGPGSEGVYNVAAVSHHGSGRMHPNESYHHGQSWVSSSHANQTSPQSSVTEAIYDPSTHSPGRMQLNESYSHAQNWASPPHAADMTSPHMDYYSQNRYPLKTETPMSGPMPGPNYSVASPNPREDIPRPPTVKRDTSHKLETIDIEPTKKRMNRQSSMSSVDEQDIRHLNDSLEQSSLAVNHVHPFEKPQNLKHEDRVQTIDRVVVDFEGASSLLDGQTKDIYDGLEGSHNDDGEVVRPRPLNDNDRLSTLGTIDSDFLGELATNAAPV